jgi:hypothetical protein
MRRPLFIPGSGVYLPGDICARLRHPLLADLKKTDAPEYIDAVKMIDDVGASWANRHVADVATPQRPHTGRTRADIAVDVANVDAPRVATVEWSSMSVTNASRELKISQQAVKGLLTRGTLHGERGYKSWLVCRESVNARLENTKCQHEGAPNERR